MKNIIIYSILLCAGFAYSQNSQTTEADKKFNDLAYIDAINIYEIVANKGYGYLDLFQKLGDAYYFNADYRKASKWYGKLFNMESNVEPMYNFRYGQSLKAVGNYKKSDTYLKAFYNSQGGNYPGSQDYLKVIEKNSGQYQIEASEFNSKYSDYPAFYSGDLLYVISANSTSTRTPWNDEPTSDIFRAEGTQLNKLGKVLNSKYNEGSLVITKDGNTMYFTRNDYANNKLGNDSKRTIRLKLYRATRNINTWDTIEELPFNDSEYSVGHPALSVDEKKLYFISDMPKNGTKGGTDIFEVEILDDGGFGTPFNMTGFNTVGNEMFPFVDSEGTFYFSSNAQISNLGGLDIYKSSINNSSVYGEVTNLGKPINSPMDDFAFMINNDSKSGYFSTNREGTRSDDIYTFKEKEAIDTRCKVTFTGVIRDKKTGDILENALVSLIGYNNEIIDRKVVSAGLYEFDEVDCSNTKFIRAEKNGYLTEEEMIEQPIEEGVVNQDLLLDKREIAITAGTNIGRALLNPVYFDLNSSYIRPDAAIELQKIIAVMQQNPSLAIDVRSHTDSRANDHYNMWLSDRRVRRTINYIVSHGNISRDRLTGRGYGETQLVNRCSNGVECSESMHQENRRSEFIIME